MYTVYIYTSHHWNLLLRKASVSLNWSPSRKKFRNSPEIERTTLGPISDSTLTYRRWSRRSTRSCGGKQPWSTWQTSQQPALAQRRRRTWRPHWSWRESCLQERPVLDWLYMLSRPTVCAKAGEESSLQGGPDLVREVEQRSLDTEHEGHPLVVGGVGGRVTALHSLTTWHSSPSSSSSSSSSSLPPAPQCIWGEVGTPLVCNCCL